MRPALVTDSNSQLSNELRDRFSVHVVPVTVVVDGKEFLEGVDLDADGFYEFFADGVTPEVSTSQPSPGAFVETYQRCIDAGHDEIISIHVTKGLSGTINSARIAAEMVDAQVHLLDTRTASFGIACCVWAAGMAIEDGAGAAEALAVADRTADGLYSVTAVGAAELVNASGRVQLDESGSGIDLFTTAPEGVIEMLPSAHSVDEVCDSIAAAMTLGGEPIRVALGVADETAMAYWQGIESRLNERDDVVEIVRYRIGPSVGAFFGPGTAGGFWYAASSFEQS